MTTEYQKRRAELSRKEQTIGRYVADRLLHDVTNATLGGVITEKLEVYAMSLVDDEELTHRELLRLIAIVDEIETTWYNILGLELPR